MVVMVVNNCVDENNGSGEVDNDGHTTETTTSTSTTTMNTTF